MKNGLVCGSIYKYKSIHYVSPQKPLFSGIGTAFQSWPEVNMRGSDKRNGNGYLGTMTAEMGRLRDMLMDIEYYSAAAGTMTQIPRM